MNSLLRPRVLLVSTAVLGAVCAGPAGASAAGPPAAAYGCVSYIGQGYTSGKFTILSGGRYRWKREKRRPSIIKLPGSGSGRFKVKGSKLSFKSGPFYDKKRKKPRYRGKWDALGSSRWQLQFRYVPVKPKRNQAAPAPFFFIQCYHSVETEDEPEPETE